MSEYSRYEGWDVYKITISVPIAEAGRDKSLFFGDIEITQEAILRIAMKHRGGRKRAARERPLRQEIA